MKKLAAVSTALLGLALLGGCYEPTASTNDVQREQQENQTRDIAQKVGMPYLPNARDSRQLKYWYELRDVAGLMTYAYTMNMQGQWVWICDSVGFPFPGGTQFSAPSSIQRYSLPATDGLPRDYGTAELPQPEPNGVFPPSSADASGLLCVNPDNPAQVGPAQIEDRVNVFMWPKPNAINEPDRTAKPQGPVHDPIMDVQLNPPAPKPAAPAATPATPN